MGDRSFSRRSSGLHLLVRLTSLVAALLVLCVTGRASANALVVPMCGERNESIAAPPIFRNNDGGSIQASPCHADDAFGVGQNAPPAPERVVVYQTPERVLAFAALFIVQQGSSRISIAGASQALKQPGFVETLFRPPRA